MAVLERWIFRITVLFMARLAHIVGAKALVESGGAAIHTFPVDLSDTMNFAGCLTSTDLLEKAFLAQEILFLSLFRLGISHLLLAIDEATEVRHFAAVALVYGATLVGESLSLSIVVSVIFDDTGVLKDALLLSILECKLLALLLEADKRA